MQSTSACSNSEHFGIAQSFITLILTTYTLKNQKWELLVGKKEIQTETNKEKSLLWQDQNSTPLLDNVEFNNEDLPSASRDKSNCKHDIQRTGEETKVAKENQPIIGIQTCVAKFEREADKLLSGNRKRRHNKASKGVRTNMSIMFAATSNMDVSLPGEVIPSAGASNVTRPQLTVPEIHTKEKKYLDSWMVRQIKKDNLKK
ncbi:unnamed protein product [Mytilus edulis]|uniref:Uncharacterized protein n=1 Tax=Mytilus edulis TaxID=6550 RepID=A0A8S3UJ70_MYTED|nr:unnamed protein product [Mytilus edulis]